MHNDDRWRDWRLKSGTFTWRLATLEDEPELEAIRARTSRLLGPRDPVNYFAPPVILCLVAEDESGIVVDAIYVEVAATITKVSASREVFEQAACLVPELEAFLALRGFRWAYFSVPTRAVDSMRGAVTGAYGFQDSESDTRIFKRKLPKID